MARSTLVTLREYIEKLINAMHTYFDTRIDNLKEYIETRIRSLEQATALASSVLTERLDKMNEIRDQLRVQAETFFLKVAHEQFADKIDGEICRIHDDIKILRENKVNSTEYSQTILRIETSIDDLVRYKATMEGKASMQSVIVAYILSGLSILIAVVSLMDKFIK